MLEFPDSPLADGQFRTLMGAARKARVTGLLWQAVVDGALATTSQQADEVELSHIRSLSGALVLERLLLETIDLLERAEVPVRVLKGTAIAHLDFPESGLRTFGDIDLMVPSEYFDAAVAILVRHGHRRNYPEPRPGFDRRFSKGASFQTADGLEIDLHRTFTMGPHGMRLDLESLWARKATFELGGRKLYALAKEERFLHACYHAALGEKKPLLTPLRDVAQIALTTGLDMPTLHHLIRASQAEAVVSRAVQAAWSELHLADLLAISAWAMTYRVDPREAAEIAAYGDGSTYATKSMAALRSLPSWSQRAAYVFALVAPQDSYLDGRHTGRSARLRAAARETAARRRHP
jgi:hypothetical protein